MIRLNTGFFRNSGTWVLASSVLAKVLAFVMTLFLVRYLPKDDFGILTIALNFASFFIPAVGLGSSHGLLRYGATNLGVKKLSAYALGVGFLFQVIVSIAVIIAAAILHLEERQLFLLCLLMAIRLFGLFFLEQAKAETRGSFNNVKYAQIEIISSVLAVILGIPFTMLWGIEGYVVSLCIFPLVVFLMHRFSWEKTKIPRLLRRSFWNYSINSVLTLIVFMWIFLLDVFFVGRYFSAEEVGFYKICTVVPMNLLVLSQIYTQTLYPELCKNHRNKSYLLNFIRNYYLIFIPITAIFVILGFIFDQEVLSIFGFKGENSIILKLMYLQMASIMLFRIPFAQLMAAMGDVGVSLIIGMIMLVGICVAMYFYLPTRTPVTAAYIVLIFITLGGLMAAAFFCYRLFTLKT